MTAVAKLFMNGRSQAVRLPAEFRFQGTEVEIWRDPETGHVVLAEKPRRTGSWDKFLAAIEALGPEDVADDFMKERDQGTQERDDPFA